MEEEKWRPLKGEYGDYYEVSDRGNVRSVDRTMVLSSGRLYRRKGKQLSATANKRTGLLQVMLYIHRRYKMCYVHRLVAEAFCENPHGLHYVTHLNGDILDNGAENLRYVTRSSRKNKELNLI